MIVPSFAASAFVLLIKAGLMAPAPPPACAAGDVVCWASQQPTWPCDTRNKHPSPYCGLQRYTPMPPSN